MQAQQQGRGGVIGFGHAAAAALVRLADQRQLGDAGRLAETIAALQQVVHRLGPQLGDAVHAEVFATGRDRQLAVVGRHLVAVAHRAQRVEPGALVHHVLRQGVDRRQRLAQVVGERREPHARIARREPRSHVADHQGVQPGIDLGVVVGALRHAEQRVHLRQQH
jgi:hypothetical protein